jgi:hypothetical protein
MSFVASAATPVQPPTPVLQDGWWPDIDLVQLRARANLDASITDERLRFSVVMACFDVNKAAWEWRQTQQAAGAQALGDVAAPEIDGQSVLMSLYLRAVTCGAQVDLYERYRGVDTTAAGDRKADTLDTTVADLRRNKLWAISDLVGRGRTTVELI